MEAILKFFAKNDSTQSLYWNSDLEFFVICNDTFFPASADAESVTESVTESDIPMLQTALDDTDDFHFTYLYCARKRRMRPMTGFYKCCIVIKF